MEKRRGTVRMSPEKSFRNLDHSEVRSWSHSFGPGWPGDAALSRGVGKVRREGIPDEGRA